jgi:hypothetical protein
MCRLPIFDAIDGEIMRNGAKQFADFQHGQEGQ